MTKMPYLIWLSFQLYKQIDNEIMRIDRKGHSYVRSSNELRKLSLETVVTSILALHDSSVQLNELGRLCMPQP